MRFGIRECTNIVFRAKTNMAIGTTNFKAGQPVLYIDSAKTSTLEGAGTTVYATGGRGNTNLIAWEGEKTLTFTMEDALISPLGMAILSGAGLLDNNENNVHVHRTALASVEGEAVFEYYLGGTSAYSAMPSTITNDQQLKEYLIDVVTGEIENSTLSTFIDAINANVPDYEDNDLIVKQDSTTVPGAKSAIDYILSTVKTVSGNPTTYTSGVSPKIVKKVGTGSSLAINIAAAVLEGETLCGDAPLYILKTEPDGSLTNEIVSIATSGINTSTNTITLDPLSGLNANDTVFVDFYVISAPSSTKEIQIDAEHFAGYFYVEADTLFRRQIDGKDCPAVITLPNVKIQSNFTFTMASSGDPSTFTFTMDAMPGYTYFNKTKKVLCVVQIIDNSAASGDWQSVMPHFSGDSHVSKHEDIAVTNDNVTYPTGTFLDSNITESPSN